MGQRPFKEKIMICMEKGFLNLFRSLTDLLVYLIYLPMIPYSSIDLSKVYDWPPDS